MRGFFRPLSAVSLALWVSAIALTHAEGPSSETSDREDATLSAAAAQRAAGLDDAAIDRLLQLHHADRADVRMVLLPATVTNRRGRPVRDLEEDDFELSEDRVPQEIAYFATESNTAVDVAFLLDVSGSMRQSGKLEAAKDAIRYFVESLSPEDRVGLVCFADRQVSWVTPFTTDRERFLARLDVQYGYGKTALNDAVAAAPGLVDETTEGRKAIVLFSDGVDNASRMSDWEAIKTARRVAVPIYAVGFTAMPEGLRVVGEYGENLRLLWTFTRESGGRMFPVRGPDELKEAAAEIIDELRFQYVLGYYPTNEGWDGRFRRVELEADKDSLQVRTRRGYYAEP